MTKTKINFKKLSFIEFLFYSSILFTSISYAFILLSNESSKLKNLISPPSAGFFNSNRDNADYDWNNFLNQMITENGIIYLGIVPIIDNLTKKYLPQFNKLSLTIYSFWLISTLLSTYVLIISFALNITVYLLTNFKSKLLIWSCIISFMIFLNTDTILQKLLNVLSRDKLNEFIVFIYFMKLRLICFSMDKINGLNYVNFDFKTLLWYSYYPSFYYVSSFVSLKNFIPILNSKEQQYLKRYLIITIIKIIISGLVIELVLHLTSVYTINLYADQLVDRFSKPSLTMAVYLKGSLFACKYTVYYGLTNLCNKLVGMKTSELPRCVSLIHTNSEMWRYFDTGIYDFIKNYLYIPFGGSKNTKSKQLISLVFSFGFISFWHGLSFRVSLWSFTNFIMVLIEIIYTTYVLKLNQIKNRIDKLRFKRVWLSFLLSVWQLMMHYVSTMFLTNIDSMNLMYSKSIFSDLTSFLIILAVYYCNAQIRLDFIDLII